MADHTALDWRDSIGASLGPFTRGSEENAQANGSCQTKVLVVTSSRSGCFPAAGPLKVVELVNGDGTGESDSDRARGVVVDWGGHWCYWEKPELFNNLILDFLDGKYENLAKSVEGERTWVNEVHVMDPDKLP